MESQPIPDLTLLRRILFWDTKMETIDWQRHKKAVIKRVFERGNDIEKNEILRFYGSEAVDEVLQD
jgi:hypothetical protein